MKLRDVLLKPIGKITAKGQLLGSKTTKLG